MKRIRFDEEMFTTLVNRGRITIDGVTFSLKEMLENGNFKRMIEGEEIEQSGAKVILADIGYDRISRIISNSVLR